MEDKDSTQTAVIFHPKTIQMMRFKADLLATPAEDLEAASQEAKKRKKELQKQQETAVMEGELDNLVSLQQGAHMVPQPVGASLLRQADLQQSDPSSSASMKRVGPPPPMKLCWRPRRHRRRRLPPTKPWMQNSEAVAWP